MTFEQWMAKVDALCATHFSGLTSDDLPDMDYWDQWHDDTTPFEMFVAICEYNGFPC